MTIPFVLCNIYKKKLETGTSDVYKPLVSPSPNLCKFRSVCKELYAFINSLSQLHG